MTVAMEIPRDHFKALKVKAFSPRVSVGVNSTLLDCEKVRDVGNRDEIIYETKIASAEQIFVLC